PPYYGPARPHLRAARVPAEQRAARSDEAEAQAMPPPQYQIYYPVQVYGYPWPYWTYRPLY
ncbi:hypothetical protein, partial [Acidisphaera rubrifaciens]|uniref:hypothetical protein n=1 Tax=Acidisphaera rubrifaciens TaxID=50715 RepID=UPI000662A098